MREKELIRRLRRQPDDVQFRLELGRRWTENGLFGKAAQIYEEGVTLDPSNIALRMNLGESLLDLNQTEAATQQFREVIRRHPGHPSALASLGGALLRMRQPEEAAEVLIQGARVLPDDAVVCELLGEALADTGRPQDALASYQRAAQLGNRSRNVLFALAILACNQCQYATSDLAIREGASLSGDTPVPWQAWGKSLFELGDVTAAVEAFRKGHSPAGAASLRELALIIPGDPTASHDDVLSFRREYAASIVLNVPAVVATRDPSKRPRVGYVSSFFAHPNYMKPVYSVLNHHDPSRVHVALFHDGPDVERLRSRIPNPAVAQIHDVSHQSNAELIRTIHDRQLDIVVDLNAFSAMHRLPIYTVRLARHMIGWFNHYATSGLPEMDYLIGDAQVIREQERGSYGETILELPQSYLSFRVDHPAPAIVPPPFTQRSWFTLGCLCSQYKVTPSVLKSWSRILRLAPATRLILANRTLESADVVDRLREFFKNESIDLERIEFRGGAPHFNYLENYNDIDAALDTWPYNGGTTTTEAIWQGVPVFCFRGDRWASRTSASLVCDGPFRDFLSDSLDEMESMAVLVANDANDSRNLTNRRLEARKLLSDSPVCNVAQLAREMESIYVRLADS